MVSVVIITLNEADRLPATLEAVRWCTDIVIVDSGSSDDTLRVAQEFGARVIAHPFAGYGAQKQFACSQAQQPWILSLDADEVITPELAIEIEELLKEPQHVAYRIPRRFRFLGRTFRHGKGSIDFPIRLFRADRARYNDATVHESVLVQGTIGTLHCEMLHDSYRDLDHYFEKFNHYTTIAARSLIERGIQRSVALTVLTLPIYFIKHYLINGHILNGREGLVWSVFSSLYPFVKVSKARWSTLRSQSQ